MSKTIKPPLLNPLLVLLTLRAASSLRARVGENADSWSVCPGLRLANPDPDRVPGRWTASWPEATRRSLLEAWSDPLLRRAVSGKNSPLSTADLAEQIGAGSVGDTIHWGKVETPNNASVLKAVGWSLPESPSCDGWCNDMLSAWARLRSQASADSGFQLWLDIAPGSSAAAWWTERRVADSLRWGAGWWFSPPQNGDWDGYAAALQAAGRRISAHPAWNQWVWPWADLVQQAMEECMKTGSVSARCGPPFVWPRRKGEDWGRLRKVLWDDLKAAVGPPGLLEDLMAGVCFARPGDSIFDG